MAVSRHMENSDYTLSAITDDIQQQWKWFVTGGVLSISLGLLAIVYPMVASITFSLLLGWILLVSGAFQALHAFQLQNWKGFFLTLAGGIAAIAVGALMVLYPFSGVAAVTLLVAGFLLVSGIFRLFTALQIRPNDHWFWLFMSGIFAVLLSMLVIFQFPFSAAWFIGLLLGIDLVFAGTWLLMLAYTTHKHRKLS